MEVVRDLILTLTILSIIFIADHWPKPVKAVKVDYCQTSAGKFELCAGLKYRLSI